MSSPYFGIRKKVRKKTHVFEAPKNTEKTNIPGMVIVAVTKTQYCLLSPLLKCPSSGLRWAFAPKVNQALAAALPGIYQKVTPD